VPSFRGWRRRDAFTVKIWMVHPRLDRRGGAENLIHELCRGLLRRGHEVSVAALRFDPNAWPEEAWSGLRIAILERPIDRLAPRRWRATFRARRLARLVAGSDFAVAHNFPAPLWVAGCAAPGDRPRRIWYCHEPSERLHGRIVFPTLTAAGEAGPDAHPWAEGAFVRQLARLDERRPRATRLDRHLDRRAVASLDAVLANSAFTAAAVERVYGATALACPPGVAPRAAEPGAAGARVERPYVAWVTNPRVAKNARGFLEALRLARTKAPDLAVRALGLDAALREKVAALGLSDAVVALDPLDDADYARLLAGARFVAYASIDEPFGLVPLDAMAQGRALLASSCGGPAESVVDGVTGVRVDPLDPEAVADALVALWRDASRCDALGRAGRERYERVFTLERFLDRFEEALGSPD
jgi:glycosyltransferase involved in cell wall biosynthesis